MPTSLNNVAHRRRPHIETFFAIWMITVPQPSRCPRCGSTNVEVCGESVEYAPEERPGQPLEERQRKTTAYHCECGLGFTVTAARGTPSGDAT